MKIKQIHVSGFRSINDTSLDNCGGFNVLIGKNNAGKSNLLLAIDAFFSMIKGCRIVALNSAYSDEHNFAVGETSKLDFEVTLTFHLEESFIENLIDSIVSEFPQVATAADQLKISSELSVKVIFNRRLPGPYIQSILILNNEFSHSILQVNPSSAEELLNTMSQIQELTEIISEISGFRNNFPMSFDRMKKDEDYLRHFIFSSRSGNKKMTERMIKLISESETEDELKKAIERESNVLLSMIEELENKTLDKMIDTFAGKTTKIPQYINYVLEQIATNKVLYLTERRDPIGKKEANQLLDLKVKRGGTEQMRGIQELVSSLLGVEIDAFKSESSRPRDNDAELDVDQFLVQLNGAGVREALRLILDYEFEQPQVLLVEEPEIHLHPALESSMMRYLKTCGQKSQVFITTHSTNFLDTAELNNVYLISRSSGTKAELLSFDDAESKIPKELGIRLSSLFMFDRLIFVEGPSDEEVLREFASKLGINLANASVGFVPMGGIRNLAYFAAESTLDFLSKRQVKMWFIIDRDEHEEDELAKFADRLGDQAKLMPLSKRELENYLLVPEALCKFVALKNKISGKKSVNEPTIEDMNVIMSECVDELKEVAVERRIMKKLCVPHFPNRRQIQENLSQLPIDERMRKEFSVMTERISEFQKQLEEVIQNSQGAIENDWVNSKYDIVPGDLLIDEVCKHFETRFKKGKDSGRLASLITSDKIDTELRNLLQEIGADSLES